MLNTGSNKLVNNAPIHIGLWCLFFVIFYIFYQNTIHSLFARWVKFDEAYGHGLLILSIIAYLLFSLRNRLSHADCMSNYYASIPLVIMSVLWAFAYLMDIIIIQQLLLPILVLNVVLIVYGIKLARLVMFPVCYIYFAIPIWDYLTSFFVNLTSNVVSQLIMASRMTAFINGNMITIPYGNIIIADGCSGIRYFLIATALSVLFAHLHLKTLKSKIFLVSLSICIGLITNWIRVYSLILIGYISKMESGLLSDHEYLGWALFMVLFFPLIYYFNAYYVDSE